MPAGEPLAPRAGAHILIVEDDPGIRESIAECLALEGYQVATARNGIEGLAALGSGPLPALVLLDLVMPAMDGREFLERMKSDPAVADIPVLLMTALPAGGFDFPRADAWLAKPFDVDELLGEVERRCRPRGAG